MQRNLRIGRACVTKFALFTAASLVVLTGSASAGPASARVSKNPGAQVDKSKAKPKPIWLAVARPMFVTALKPLVAFREKDGFETVVSTASFESAIEALGIRRPAYVLLVGDDLFDGMSADSMPGQSSDPNGDRKESPASDRSDGVNEVASATDKDVTKEAWYFPSARRKFYRWRSEQHAWFISDPALADLDGDLMPDFPIGRIPARTTADVEAVVRKIIEYEGRPASLGDLGLPVWSGSPMYGEAIDAMANGLLLNLLQTSSPKWTEPWVMMGDATQPFCGWPDAQPDLFVDRMRLGGLLDVFIGHGNVARVLSMRDGFNQIDFTTEKIQNALRNGPSAPPMLLLTCLSGNFAAGRNSMTEALLFAPGGSVAAIGASTESHPLANYYTGQHLLAGLGGRKRRLGDAWTDAQTRARHSRNYVIEAALADVEGSLEKVINIDALQRDQVLMYNLLGDPATKLKLPGRLRATIEKRGDAWHWRAKRPKGTTRLEVGFRAAEIKLPGPGPRATDKDAAQAALQRANQCFAFEPLETLGSEKKWEGEIDRPGNLRLAAIGEDRIYVIVLEAR